MHFKPTSLKWTYFYLSMFVWPSDFLSFAIVNVIIFVKFQINV